MDEVYIHSTFKNNGQICGNVEICSTLPFFARVHGERGEGVIAWWLTSVKT